MEQQRGNPDGAAETLTRAMSAAQRSGDLRIAATARTTLARLMRASGDDVVAAALLEQTDRWYRTAGGGDGALLVRGMLAAIADDGDLDGVLAEARRTGDREAELVALDGLARRAETQGDRAAATRLLAEADELHAGLGHLVDEADRTDAAVGEGAGQAVDRERLQLDRGEREDQDCQHADRDHHRLTGLIHQAGVDGDGGHGHDDRQAGRAEERQLDGVAAAEVAERHEHR